MTKPPIPSASRHRSEHHVLQHPRLPGIVTVPRHGYTKKGTLSRIIKQTGLALRKFDRLYR
ncbi:MAG: type II toxin-antitoxin system HicA family toxin [Phycisphaerae bacterium]|nr:type II toxin-antitoxin system HicA family toxin [Phycisphaerae bacterium]MDP7637372.1 type II toxin-antitoxin system HicA family toxin [Phycisphaerae bacterium]